jgi:RecA/RadA recombinase
MPFISANELAEQESKFKRLAFRVGSLDLLTNGGIDVRNVTEIYGESGSGKTQICLQLALNVQLAEALGGLNKKAVYINTEGPFPSQRLLQMTNELKKQLPDYKDFDFSSNIFISQLIELNGLMDSMKNLEKLLKLESSQIGLIVLDSVGLFRLETSNYIERAKKMRAIGRRLLRMADYYECAVVIVNQVSSFECQKNSVMIPALGINWTRLINTRIGIFKNQNFKSFYVEFSPRLANATANFRITKRGIQDVL